MAGFDDGGGHMSRNTGERASWLTSSKETGTPFYSCEDLNSVPARWTRKGPLSSR